MSARSIVTKQLLRQTALQPCLKLPAGRVVMLEEGRRLARLVHEEEERAAAVSTAVVEERALGSPVVLEEGVSKRILLLRQKSNKEANIKAAVAHAQRSKVPTSVAETGEEVRDIAVKLLRKDSSARGALKGRHERSKGKKASKKH
ncbi:hypothetical protein DQ04_09161050 [Trypanosoma grayi]|uniref:hypothetical protein n=1 Tax=Trypanosoma grayi TaxID=71804 RepID=UPI0004F49422|nr:hypothetical protein DQ04_09161050 [Trypanosoma grayi]KEG07662.1 hypothetical protein DQ04_09161050 [Trypanosoma grayi]